MFGTRFTRALVVATTASLVLATVALAATEIDNTDRAVIGTASTSALAAALTCGGSAVNIELDVVADNGNVPDNSSYPASGTVTAPNSLTITSGGLVASGSQSQTFTAAQNFNQTAETLTFTIALSADATAPAGAQSYAITFGQTGTPMVLLGSQVNLSTDFTNPLVHANVTCASYTFDGFYSPVGGNSNGASTFNISAKAGQGIALKWNLSNSALITDVSKYSAQSVPLVCSLGGTPEANVATDDAGGSGFRYDPDGEQTVYVWKTVKSWANTCRTLQISYDGTLVAELDVHFTK